MNGSSQVMQNWLLDIDQRGVARITLNRADRHNAFDDVMIGEMIRLVDEIEQNNAVRIVVLTAAGKNFSAGADLNWMSRMAEYDYELNFKDAMQLAELLKRLNGLDRPVIGMIHGASFGGGVGLVACCDIVIAADNSRFCLSEVRLGLIPATISPYVINAMGERACRRYFLTAEPFNAEEAHRLGLVHQVVSEDLLDEAVEKQIEALLKGGPRAQAAAKKLIDQVARREIDEKLIEDTAERIAQIRASDEGGEGLNAFLQKRKPDWDRN